MAEAVARVARRINSTVEEGKDSLDLSECKLISFPDGAFKVLRTVTDKIRRITLANNEIKALNSRFFTTFSQLEELDLQGNELRKLPVEVGQMEHLVIINLSKNKFSVFPEELTKCVSLQVIDLEANEIPDVPLEQLSAMPALTQLNVRANPTGQGPTHSGRFELLTGS